MDSDEGEKSMIEVEVKLPIEDAEALISKLIEMGFSDAGEIFESDTYFTHAHHDFWKLDEALRIRRCEHIPSGEKTAVVTYKGAKMDQVSTTRPEYETGVEDPDTFQKILEAIDFSPVIPVKKLRHSYCKEDITVCVDKVSGLGAFMEVEILVEDAIDRRQALGQIGSLLQELGYNMSDTTRRSYLGMLLDRQ